MFAFIGSPPWQRSAEKSADKSAEKSAGVHIAPASEAERDPNSYKMNH